MPNLLINLSKWGRENIGIAVIIIIGVTGTLIFTKELSLPYPSASPGSVSEPSTYRRLQEIWLQFFLVIVLGGAVAYSYRRYEQEKERRRAEREALRLFLKSGVQAYHDIRKVRRVLRALSNENGKGRTIKLKDFLRLMERLEESQLRLEELKSEFNARSDYFKKDIEKIPEDLNLMIGYIRLILREYEDSCCLVTDGKETPIIFLKEEETISMNPHISGFCEKRSEEGECSPGTKKRLKELNDPASRIEEALLEKLEKS